MVQMNAYEIEGEQYIKKNDVAQWLRQCADDAKHDNTSKSIHIIARAFENFTFKSLKK